MAFSVTGHRYKLIFAFKSLMDKIELKSTQADYKSVLIIVFVSSFRCQYLEDDRVGVIKIVIVINCNLITFSKVIACNCN